MSEPIKKGDLCEVIDGLQGASSPNIGLIVEVQSLAGEHSKFGRIWRCLAEFAERGQPGVEVPGRTADFAQSWLRKLPPKPQAPKAKTRDLELAA